MANKTSCKDKHKKKHKKERKKKKSKKSKCKSDFSDSSSSGSRVSSQNDMGEKPLEKSEWGFLDTVLSNSYVSGKDRKNKVQRAEPEKPGQNVKELNPYWKDGGCGLPPTETESALKNKREGIKKTSSLGSTGFSKDYYSNRKKCSLQPEFGNEKKKLNFLKPGNSSGIELSKNISRGNWKKKEFREPEVVKEVRPEASGDDKGENTVNALRSVSNEDLNKLAAKLVKAEILGNTALINKLKAELEAAKKAKDSASSISEESGAKDKVTVIVTDRVSKKPHDAKESHFASKRQKVITHYMGQRTCYFPDDDKYSLKNLFEKEKESCEQEILLPSKLSGKNAEEMDDMYLEAATSNKMQQKVEKIEKQREIKEAVVKHRMLKGCHWCIDNRNSTKHLVVSTGSKCYLCLPEQESLTQGHCVIVPIQHEISMMHLDEDVWNEIKMYQRVLTQMFLEQEKDVVFFENARSFKHFPHCIIQCVPVSKETGDLAPIYFQKAIAESETEWSNNKKVIDFRQKDMRRSLPKGLPYFAVIFGTSGGFAHIIEDENLFKRNFAEEVLGNMMDLDYKKWRKPQKDNFRAQREKALEFLKMWKKFEFNEKNPSDSESNSSN